LRGVGGIMLHPHTGKRFVDELGTRDHISQTMLTTLPDNPNYVIVINPKSAAIADKHIPLYSSKGLLQKFDSLEAVAKEFQVPINAVQATIAEYVAVGTRVNNGETSADQFGKRFFHNLDGWSSLDGPFYAGLVTPAAHYTMGGVRIDNTARVLSEAGAPIHGLFAAGEVVGGIHGENRLGGNALTEALVFGRVASKSIVKQLRTGAGSLPRPQVPQSDAQSTNSQQQQQQQQQRTVSREELEAHQEDNWVQIGNVVYDFSEFVEEHPAGPEAITDLAGSDGTDAFHAVHTDAILEDFDDVVVGVMGG